ncbi:MAG: nitroreductase family protein [Vallitaleaceae bacterium]|nr:nitroreductase family protein [Vallitaleaceae bacterium]
MILDLLKQRYSARQFSEKPILKADLEDILEAGRISPSGGNEQAWHFIVVNDPELIFSLSDVCFNQSWIRTSPLAILLCVEPVSDERGCRNIQCSKYEHLREDILNMPKELFDALNQEEHQTKIAGTQMSVVALEKGIYSTWVSYFDASAVSQLLKLPSSVQPAEILVFGYPKTTGKMRTKKNTKDIVHYNGY